MLTEDHPSSPVVPRSRKDAKPKIEVIRAAIATDAEFCPRYNQRAALVSACIAYPDGAVDHFLHPDLRPLDLDLEGNERAWYFRLGESSRPLDIAIERTLNTARPGENWRVTRHPVFGYPEPIPLRLHLIIRFFFSPLDVRTLWGEAMFETFLRAGKFEQRRRFKVKSYRFASDSTGQTVLLQSLTYPYLAFDDAGRACKIGIELEDLFGISPPKCGLEKTLKAYGVSATYMEHKDAWNHLKTRPDLYWKEAPHIMRDYVRGDTMSLHDLSDEVFKAENRLRENLHLPTLSRQQMAHTNGAINARLIEDWLLSRHADVKAALKHLDIRNARDNTVIEKGLAQAGTRHFANANDTSWFLAAVQGGRCHNERPDEYRILRAVLPDLKAAYASIMAGMAYPVGLPTVLGWKINEPLPLTLEKFLAKWEPELVDDAWMAVVSTRPGLSFSFRFDLIMSKLSVYQEATSDDTDAANEHADDAFIAGDTCILYKPDVQLYLIGLETA